MRDPKIFGANGSAGGTITGVSKPGNPSILNVDESAFAEGDASEFKYRTGFPKQDGQSLSYWLQQVRNDPLLDYRSTPDLPAEADTVVIGSGVCGPSCRIRYLLTFECPFA